MLRGLATARQLTSEMLAETCRISKRLSRTTYRPLVRSASLATRLRGRRSYTACVVHLDVGESHGLAAGRRDARGYRHQLAPSIWAHARRSARPAPLSRAFTSNLQRPLPWWRDATDLGGLLDFIADFVVYAGFIVGVAIARPGARLACVALLAAYLVNNVALLSFSSVIERRGLPLGDERSLRLIPGLIEGTEMIVVDALFCLVPGASAAVAWAFAALVAVTATQRVDQAVNMLRQSAAQTRVASRHCDV